MGKYKVLTDTFASLLVQPEASGTHTHEAAENVFALTTGADVGHLLALVNVLENK